MVVARDASTNIGSLQAPPDSPYVACSDGTFLTIDSDSLNCGLEGCTHDKITSETRIGYNRKAGVLALYFFAVTLKPVPGRVENVSRVPL